MALVGAPEPLLTALRIVGLVHMPGIFFGMILAGPAPIAAALVLKARDLGYFSGTRATPQPPRGLTSSR